MFPGWTEQHFSTALVVFIFWSGVGEGGRDPNLFTETQLFHIWHWELWHHLKSLRGSNSPWLGLEQSGGGWDKREREKEGKREKDGDGERVCMNFSFLNMWLL